MNWDFIYRGETLTLDEAVRAQAGGAFAKLPDGQTHYELKGPPDGPPVVLVHGFSVPYFIWDPTFQGLAEAGFRALRYDLYGRGLSDRPRTDYGLSLYLRQLDQLLEALHIRQIHLIGLSMGGAISTAFTVAYPGRVRKLVLIDPIGAQPMPLSMIYKAASLPGVSELILGLLGTDQMVKGIASDFFDPRYVEMFQEQYRTQMQYKGFKRAILSTLRNKMVDGFPALYHELGTMEVPVLLLWGRNDQTLPLKQSQSILAAVPQADFHIIEGCGHIPHYEKAGEVNPLLVDFLESK